MRNYEPLMGICFSVIRFGIFCWFVVWAGLAQADTIHFGSGVITAQYSGTPELIGSTRLQFSNASHYLVGFGTMDASCGFCGNTDTSQRLAMFTLPIGVESATLNGSPIELWGGLVITGNPFLLPNVRDGSFTATIPISVSGWFVNPQDFFTVPQKGIMRIKFVTEDGAWRWDSVQITFVPEPSSILLFGTGLTLLGFGLRHRFLQKIH